jgi:hypothetical protein
MSTAVTLPVGSKTITVHPIGMDVLQQWQEKLAQQNLSYIPSLSELLSAVGSDAGRIREAVETIVGLRRQASDPSIEQTMAWVGSDPGRLIELILDCVPESERAEVTHSELFGAVVAASKAGGDGFVSRWLALSGLGDAPKPANNAERRTAKRR